jgi:hypothetical protein
MGGRNRPRLRSQVLLVVWWCRQHVFYLSGVLFLFACDFLYACVTSFRH